MMSAHSNSFHAKANGLAWFVLGRCHAVFDRDKLNLARGVNPSLPRCGLYSKGRGGRVTCYATRAGRTVLLFADVVVNCTVHERHGKKLTST